ncbi:hypothetical protein O181_009762 [Austropuccinia psidii MF-1]|uniref:Uncharacterized protein n=1 Tax=Austropuccinia psidii MF-1 TaxID=1389203 RepID=A0A9Q3BRB8_9BASI|nr:hypothetical protein [Austropuccinia psidii MF-1]
MRNHKLFTKLPGDLEHAVKYRCSKDSTLVEISTNFQEVRIRTAIGRYNTHSIGDKPKKLMIQNMKSQQDLTTVNHPITMQTIFPKTGKGCWKEQKKQEKTKKVMNLTLIVWWMAVAIIHTVSLTPMRNIWCTLRTMEERKLVQSTPKGGNQ